MAIFRYPMSDFDRPAALLSALGGYWSSVYVDDPLVLDYVAATGQLANQTNRQIVELVNSTSRKDIPLYHEEDWYPIFVRESVVQRQTKPLAYDATVNYGESFVYGQNVAQPFYYVPKPAELVRAAYIFDRLISPTVSLCDGIDVQFTASEIVFRTNPFDEPSFPKRDILDGSGRIVDRELVLWCYAGKLDWKAVYEQFGYVLGLELPTSDAYKNFLNAIFDSMVHGTSAAYQRWAVAAAFGVPVVQRATETVEEVRTDLTELTIVTDANAYVFPAGSSPVVAAGDTVHAGDFLADVVQIFEFGNGQVPTAAELPSLMLENGMLAYGYWHGLVFENKLVDVVVEPDVDGYTRISWPLGGFSLDVEKFWNDTHAAGVAKGQTLAMLLDRRESPVGQPFAACLPTQINPLAFLLQNFLRANAFVVKVRLGQPMDDALPFVPSDCLRRIQPPHTVAIFLFELAHTEAPIIMDSAGSESGPGYTEQLSAFGPVAVISESLTPDVLVAETVVASSTPARCL